MILLGHLSRTGKLRSSPSLFIPWNERSIQKDDALKQIISGDGQQTRPNPQCASCLFLPVSRQNVLNSEGRRLL